MIMKIEETPEHELRFISPWPITSGAQQGWVLFFLMYQGTGSEDNARLVPEGMVIFYIYHMTNN